MEKTSKNEQIITVGVDDGYGLTKVVVLDGTKPAAHIAIPSRAVPGVHITTDVVTGQSGNNGPSAIYVTEGAEFTVGNLRGAEGTRFDDYPLSDLNRVIIHHALRLAGMGGRKVRIATGLPVGVFYAGFDKNLDLISRKDASVRKSVKAFDDSAMAEIVDHKVFPEGLGAWIDFAVGDDGTLNFDLDKTVAVIDFGGRTLDIAVVEGRQIDHSRCSTADIGVLAVIEEIRMNIIDSRKLNARIVDVLPAHLIDGALRTGVLHAAGKDIDVVAEVNAAIAKVMNAAKREINRRLGVAADIDKVLVVGGGAHVFKGVADAYENVEILPMPEFANARGFAKYLGL